MLFVLSLLTLDASAQSVPDCDGMFAHALLEAYGPGKCDKPLIPCDRDGDEDNDDEALCTPNEFQQLVYERPFAQLDRNDQRPKHTATGSAGWLYAAKVPRCVDGRNNTCPPEEELRCVDGTRPLYWVDPPEETAMCDDGRGGTEPCPARWIFTFQGGGSCGLVDGESAGETCFDAYYDDWWIEDDRYKRDQMTGWFVDPEQLGDDAKVGPPLVIEEDGIHDESLEDYANTWRVKVSKCSFDRAEGRTVLTGRDCPAGSADCLYTPDPTNAGFPSSHPGAGLSFDLHFTGHLQALAILNKLEDGSTVRRWDLPGNDLVTVPPLRDAEKIVFAGHSGGAEGLIHNLDALADVVHGWDTGTEVLGVIDARGWPGLNHTEGEYQGTDMYAENSGVYPSNAIGRLPMSAVPATRNVTRDAWTAGGAAFERDATWSVGYDTSCVAALRSVGMVDESWRCRDPSHVLFNHLSTPFFLRQALQDEKHVWDPAKPDKARDVPFAVDEDYRWTSAAYCDRVYDQAHQFWLESTGPGAQNRHRESVYGWTSPWVGPGFGLYLPYSTSHPGLFETAEFTTAYPTYPAPLSYADALWSWIDGQGSQIYVETCP